jgi:transcriptional regulator with PAS, ATPase and Fis domain
MIIPVEKLEGDRIDPFSLLSSGDRERLLRAAGTDVSILFLGETGTGKGQLARALAARSARRSLVEINCAALPDELLGSELFGHRRGAYTGAISDRKGLLAAAAGKTVFLDEIGEISLAMQRMLLRVVQRSHRSIKPLGADAEIPLPPMRFIFATNRDLENEVQAGRFREDLLRRIDVVTVTVPPLRSRPDLLPGYAARFIDELSALHKIPVRGIEKAALAALRAHAWPGNVRELKNVLERAIVTAPREKGVVIQVKDLKLSNVSHQRAARAKTLSEFEAEGVRLALEESGGSVKRAMEILGLQSRSSLYNIMRKHGISVEKLQRMDAESA